jgi:hypothetical protein
MGILAVFGVEMNDSQTRNYPTIKVAFIGDSGDGPNFGKVLELISREDVDLILHQGDFSYSSGPTRGWLRQIESHAGDIPYLGSVGNHDEWHLYYYRFFARQISTMAEKGSTFSGNPQSGNYAVAFRGVKIVFVHDRPTGLQLNGRTVTPSQYISEEFGNGEHVWRICSWHKNQTAMQVGSKDDEMGWGVYEACREHGAIIATGHEHSYERTRTLTDMQNQIVDRSCKDEAETDDVDVCVGPGKTFAFVSGLAGTSIRDQDRCLPMTFPYGCNQVWAKIYTSTQSAEFGALFITFNIDGDPNQAEGYFKNVEGKVVDKFQITQDAEKILKNAHSIPHIAQIRRTEDVQSFGDQSIERVGLANLARRKSLA